MLCRVFYCLVTNPLPHYRLPLNFFSGFFPSGTCTILMQFGYSHVPALLLGHSSGQSSTNIEPFLNSMYESLSVPTLTSSISTMKSSQVQMQTCRLRHTHIRAHAHTGPETYMFSVLNSFRKTQRTVSNFLPFKACIVKSNAMSLSTALSTTVYKSVFFRVPHNPL